MAKAITINDVPVPDSVIEFTGEALSFIASSCDGARERDDQGFSKAHAGFGKMLSMMSASLITHDQNSFIAATDLLMHYPRQVAVYAGSLDEHPDWQWLKAHLDPGNSYVGLPEARVILTDNPDSPIGKTVSLFMRNKRAVESLDQLAMIGSAIGAYEHDDGHHFIFRTAEQFPLLASLLASGLANAATEDMAVVEDIDRRLANAVDRGDLPVAAHVDGAPRDPIVLIPDRKALSQGKITFSLHSMYEPTTVSVCRRAKGRWNAPTKSWTFSPQDGASLDSLAKQLEDQLGGRVSYLVASDWQAYLDGSLAFDGWHNPTYSEDDGDERLIAPFTGLFEVAAAQASRLEAMREDDPEANPAPVDGPSGHLITGSDDRVIARIHLPYEFRDMKNDLKRLGANFDWDVKEWILPINEQNLEALKKVPIAWVMPLERFFAEREPPPFGYLDIQPNNLIRMVTPYHPDLVNFLREEIPRVDKEFDGGTKTWIFRASTPELVEKVKTLMQDFRLKLRYEGEKPMDNDQAAAVLTTLAEGLGQRLDQSYVADSTYEVPGFKLEPFPFQKAGMAYINQYGNSLVADDCGLGKTPQGIGALVDRDAFPALVVCPSIARLSWEGEFQKFTDRVPADQVVVLGIGTPKQKMRALEQAKTAKVVIINYDIISKHADFLSSIPFKGGILDESHYVKNPKALRTQAAEQIMENPTLDLKLLLSATPYMNRPSELIPQLDILEKLEAVGGARYLKSLDTAGKPQLAELNRRLRATCMIRREKREVWDEMPAVMVSNVPCEPSKDYLAAEAALAHGVIDNALNSLDRASLEDIARQLAEGDEEWVSRIISRSRGDGFGEEASVDFTAISTLRHQLGQAKVVPVLEWLKNFRDSTPADEKLVIFAYHKDVQKELFEGAKKLKLDPAWIGSQEASVRKQEEKRFQEGGARVCIASMKAARENITLTAASHSLFAELDYSGGVMIQCRDRLIRISQQAETVNVNFAMMRETLDVNMVSNIQEKMAKITNGLGDANAQDGLSAEGSKGVLAALVSNYRGYLKAMGLGVPQNAVTPASTAVPSTSKSKPLHQDTTLPSPEPVRPVESAPPEKPVPPIDRNARYRSAEDDMDEAEDMDVPVALQPSTPKHEESQQPPVAKPAINVPRGTPLTFDF
ncbi:DEAD/DEAH box helicase [Vreelandella rituensis]|uniref:ATP-dependent helicase n=1 Tax=Vreelandella rituensis TaxID=2282306 RepID=A0A368UA30_9GAMM|nr:DEAD/DEAH box helicase [Halomonas rituensis]RCV93821.1 ATP-dependent helicase [Halomonas rituensis]